MAHLCHPKILHKTISCFATSLSIQDVLFSSLFTRIVPVLMRLTASPDSAVFSCFISLVLGLSSFILHATFLVRSSDNRTESAQIAAVLNFIYIRTDARTHTLLGTPVQLLGKKLLIRQSHGSNSMHLGI